MSSQPGFFVAENEDSNSFAPFYSDREQSRAESLLFK